jgi:thiamine pyrophosphate-dependent acetolactate synthase large subunit-like protein
MDTVTEGKSTVAAALTGSHLLGKALKHHGTEVIFCLMGGPMHQSMRTAMAEGIRCFDVRHEQAAAMMATAYSRVLNRPGVCMACSGPGVMNLVTGVGQANADCTPLIVLGGAYPVSQHGIGAFQELDQVALMRPITKWAERIYDAERIPEIVATAFRVATSGKPGPVYLDFPGDVLGNVADEARLEWGAPHGERVYERPLADPTAIERALALLSAAKKPLVLSGSGIFWSDAASELQEWCETAGLPFYTTPQGRGAIPEDHALCFPHARSSAFKEADFILIVGTRMNYVNSFVAPPRFSSSARRVRIDIDPQEIAASRNLDVGIAADAKNALRQLLDAAPRNLAAKFEGWRTQLADIEERKKDASARKLNSEEQPIHPLRLCREIRDFLDRDAILAVDGKDILDFGRQSIPTFVPRHRLNSGTMGTMGVGLPYGIGAKVARPDKQVLVLHGDGSFGLNAMEIDTAVRHKVGVIVVISLNGGWCGDPNKTRPGRDLGYTRFDKMAESLGCHGEFVEKPADIRAALERADAIARTGRPALVNVLTDWRAVAGGGKFALYST